MDINLYNVNAFDLIDNIEDESIDLILTELPDEVGRPSEFSNFKDSGIDIDRLKKYLLNYNEWDEKRNFTDILMKEFYRIIKKSGTVIMFYDIWKISYLKEWMEQSKLKKLRLIEYLKTNPVPANSNINYMTNLREVALLGVKGINPTFNSKYDNGVYNLPFCNDPNKFHPTQKPLELINKLVQKHSNKGDLVLDCFSGSGTVAVSCLMNDRNFIGCETDMTYYSKSMKRLEMEERKKYG